MSGYKISKSRTSWLFPAEVIAEAIIVGVGLFEAVIFILGSLNSTISPITLTIGALYFVLPYNILMAGIGVSGRAMRIPTVHKNIAIALLNAPFLIYLFWQGSSAANYCLLLLLAIGVLFNMPKVHLRTIPGFDVVGMGIFIAGPFVYGILLSGVQGIWWLSAWMSMFMVAAANYLMYKLPTIGLEQRLHVDSTDARLGVERTIMVCVGLYIVAAVLPVIAYGWWGVPPLVLLLWYILIALQAIPFRMLAGAAGLYRVWQTIWWLNYPVGAILCIYTWYLISTKA
jgi:hypothetical protein